MGGIILTSGVKDPWLKPGLSDSSFKDIRRSPDDVNTRKIIFHSIMKCLIRYGQ